MKVKTILAATVAMVMLAGCGSNKADKTPPPTASDTGMQAGESMINIDGVLSISKNGEDYRIECKSNIPNGAFVTLYIMDENENIFTNITDLKQKVSASDEEDVAKQQGKVVTTVKAANLQKSIELNGSTQLYASLEFFPGDDLQPDDVKQVCGKKGELLTGNNVNTDDLAGQQYIAMKSDPLVIMESE